MSTAMPGKPAGLPGHRPGDKSEAAAGRRLALPRGTGRAAWSITALTVCQAALLVGAGLLITGPARHGWPLTDEDRIDEALEGIRTGALTTLSSVASEAGNTLTVIVGTLAACLCLILLPRLPRWRPAVFLALAVSLQSLVFLVITLAVDRQRPHVHRLDGSLPTSSYTSGHTGAATALYGGLAVLALTRLRGWRRGVAAGILLALPLVVGVARLYRGMHHPTDVLGGLVNGGLSLLIVGHVLLRSGAVTAPAGSASAGPASGGSASAGPASAAASAGPAPGGSVSVASAPTTSASATSAPSVSAPSVSAPSVSAPAASAPPSESGPAGEPVSSRVPAPAAVPAPASAPDRSRSLSARTVVVFNPTVTDGHDRDALRRVLADHGCDAPAFVETTAEDPGGGQAAAAVRDGATLVVVCGGDGTIRAAADALAGTGVPLAAVPCGTGNLLVRNLGLPLHPSDALDAALRGTAERVDLGRIEGDGLPATHFAAMAGAGLDAAMLQRANAAGWTKAHIGWPAYALAVLRVLRTPRMTLSVRLDDAPALHRTARMVLVGNVGTVQGNMTLLPAARTDDGRLDLLILDPRGPRGWARALRTLMAPGSTASRRPAADTATGRHEAGQAGPVEFRTFRRAEFTFTAPQPRELDGDPVAPGQHLTAEVRPGALTVLLPTRGK